MAAGALTEYGLTVRNQCEPAAMDCKPEPIDCKPLQIGVNGRSEA